MRETIRESDIENYLVRRVKAMGGEVRKVKWIGRKSAPDRLVMLPAIVSLRSFPRNLRAARTVWVELKRPSSLAAFPANAHERAQHREHERMRKTGQQVEVVGTLAGVDRLLGN